MSFPFYAIFPTQISKKYSIVLCYDDGDGEKAVKGCERVVAEYGKGERGSCLDAKDLTNLTFHWN